MLVIFGGFIGYSGDDINKFLWMIRIASGVYPDEVQEANFFNAGQVCYCHDNNGDDSQS